jgi:gliding motility-associated-like protein
MGPGGCSVTNAYNFRIPVKRSVQEERICPGDEYVFSDQLLTESGTYRDTLQTAGGCDSIIELRLSVMGEAADTVYAKIFDSETLTIGNRRFRQPGEYSLTLQSSDNCDSLVYLVLNRYRAYIPNAFSPDGNGINDYFTIYGSEEVKEIEELRIFNRWGAEVFTARGIAPGEGWDGRQGGQPAPPGVYVYLARIIMDDDKPRLVKGMVTLVR